MKPNEIILLAKEKVKTMIGTRREYQICKRCIMDTSDPYIVFDGEGICNHCTNYFAKAPSILKHGEQGKRQLLALVEEIKKRGEGKAYDCIIGLSGGVDSSYVAYKVVQLGLTPLAIHFDSGWNSELAVKNIQNIVQKLNIDLYTFVCDWKEMKDLQLAYLKAGVINADIPMDHAFIVILHRIARQKGIKYFFSGHNFETEGILPRSWVYKATDGTNVKGIQSAFGTVRLKKYPRASILENLFTKFAFGLKTINLLDFEKYDKGEAMKLIEEKLGWRYYGGKHYESVFTRFYQGYYLVERFKVDKRRAHLSTLICSGQQTRDEALKAIEKPAYTNAELLEQDLDFVPKKLGITRDELLRIIQEPAKSHLNYPNDLSTRSKIKSIAKLLMNKEIDL